MNAINHENGGLATSVSICIRLVEYCHCHENCCICEFSCQDECLLISEVTGKVVKAEG